MILKKLLSIAVYFFTVYAFSQSINQHNYNVSGGSPTNYDNPGNILYPTGYSNYSNKTPVIFVHGITGKLSGSYDANIDQVKNHHLKAAFVQLNPLGSTIDNGKLLSKMINYVRWHFNAETVSIVAHSKGGMDTERALYGQNAYVNYNYPTHSYENVDGVYTFSSPVRGARVADVGSTLSWFSGTVWATMWYTNGWSLTSGNVNGFHNWAKSWTVNSTSTFKNAYHPNGASYYRRNMREDSTTRWWAHQSDDECYYIGNSRNGAEWVFCYIGRPFQHSVGAYIDAYWEWDWFNSGWRNWHSNSDGFISEYRAKRYANTNANPNLTPGAGDFNYRTMRNANHTSLWTNGENHFTREVAPYLHNGMYNGGNFYRPANNQRANRLEQKVKVKVQNNAILVSNGNLLFAKNNNTKFIVEENNTPINFIIYGDKALSEFTLINNKTGNEITIDVIGSEKEDFSTAMASVAQTSNLEKGVYTLKTVMNDFLVVANYEKPSTAFAVNLNFDENDGYNGQIIEAAIANKDNAINFENVKVTATLTMTSLSQDTPISIDKAVTKHFELKPSAKKGFYNIKFNDLNPGSIYNLRIEAIAEKGEVLLSRNIVSSFYVKEDLTDTTSTVKVIKEPKQDKSINNIEFYPNPATDVVTVKNISNNNINSITLLDNKGNIINHFRVNNVSTSINLKEMNLPKGLYLLKVQTNNNTSIKKLVIK